MGGSASDYHPGPPSTLSGGLSHPILHTTGLTLGGRILCNADIAHELVFLVNHFTAASNLTAVIRDVASLRSPFAFFRVNKCYHDISTINCHT